MGLLKKLFNKKQTTPKESMPKVESNPVKTTSDNYSKPKPVPIRTVTPIGMKLKNELKEVDRLANIEQGLNNKIFSEEGYYGSEISKKEFGVFKEDLNNYLENNPKDFITRGARTSGLKLEFIFLSTEEEIKIYKLFGEGLYYEEDLKQYEKAIEFYKEVDKLNKIVYKDEIEELVREHGEKDYLFSGKAKDRIRMCEDSIFRREVKKLEDEAKQLEETNPKEAIKKYENLNKVNPGLKKYNNRIFRILELEAKKLEKTNPNEAIVKYKMLNELNPGLKKYNKRIEIVKRKL